MSSIINADGDGTPKLDAIRTSLIDAISNPKIVPPYELKLLYIQTFHLPTDTPEMLQLHEIQMQYKKDYNEVKAENKELRNDIKIVRFMLIGFAVASGLLGIVSADVVNGILRGLGF